MTKQLALLLVGLAPLALSTGCLGAAKTTGGQTHADSDAGVSLPPQTNAAVVGVTVGVRPMSVREFDNSMAALLLDTTQPGAASLPADPAPAFDNVFDDTGAIVTETKVDDLETLGKTIADNFLADDSRVKSVLPCVPSGPSDQACFQTIVSQLGFLFYRRPITSDETNDVLALVTQYASSDNDWHSGIEVMLRLFIQHPYFLYRTELGTLADAKSQTYELNPYELASKLSFTLWGTTPSLSLLTDAQTGKLADATYLGSLVDTMLADSRAADLVDYFHAGWLGYATLTTDSTHAGIPTDVRTSMRAETRALVKRVVFDDGRPWMDIFDDSQVWADATLATYYGLPTPSDATGAWVQQNDPLRKGILGTGSFLSFHAVTAAGETSVAIRGKNIRNQLLCQNIPDPPVNVVTDHLPVDTANPSPCKLANIKGTTLDPTSSCYSCHQQMDSVGLGLENYNTLGLFHTTEPNLPQCPIDGDGELLNAGAANPAFRGPAALADLVTQSGRVDYCMAQRWTQFTNGTTSDPAISAMTDAAVARFRETKQLKSFIAAQILAPEFQLRHVF